MSVPEVCENMKDVFDYEECQEILRKIRILLRKYEERYKKIVEELKAKIPEIVKNISDDEVVIINLTRYIPFYGFTESYYDYYEKTTYPFFIYGKPKAKRQKYSRPYKKILMENEELARKLYEWLQKQEQGIIIVKKEIIDRVLFGEKE